VFNAYSSLIALALFSFEKWWFNPVPLYVWGLLLLSIILYTVFEGTHFYGRKYVDASTASILFRLNTVISVLASFIILKEPVTLNKILATVLIVFGTYLVTVKNLSLKMNKGVIYIFIATLALGLVRPVDKTAAIYFSPPLYTFLIYAGPTFLMPLFPRIIKFQELKQEIMLGRWLIPLLGLINIFEYYFMLKAYALADASLVVPIVSLSTVFTVIVGIIFLGERDNVVKKIIAGILAFIGLLLIRM
jgi:drug/metabolite transporter (DMT)-like permease